MGKNFLCLPHDYKQPSYKQRNQPGKQFAAHLIAKLQKHIYHQPKLIIMANTTAFQPQTTKKALVIEDDGEMGLLLNILLDEKQWDLDYVKDLQSAVQYLEEKQPSFVILDNKLPDGFGVDFIGYIRNKYPSVKIIMISGFGAAREVALENGADDFLEKPFSKKRFFESLSEVVY